MVQHAGMMKGFWAKAIGVATHIINQAPQKHLAWRTPYEILFGQVPDVSYLRVFGYCAWVFNDQGKKWDPKSKLMTLVGFETGSKVYRLWDPSTCSIVVSANVKFDEYVFLHKPQMSIQPSVRTPPSTSSSKLPPPSYSDYTSVPWFSDDEPESRATQLPLPPPPKSPSPLLSPTASPKAPQQSPPTVPSSTAVEPPTSILLLPPCTTMPEPNTRKSTHKGKVLACFPAIQSAEVSTKSEGETLDTTYLQSVELFINKHTAGEPTTYQQAIQASDSDMWQKAMTEEIESLESMGTWETAPLPADRKAISCKWVYWVKQDTNGNLTCYKARLVARGFTQVYGLDYNETYAPVTRLKTIQLLLGVAITRNWNIH